MLSFVARRLAVAVPTLFLVVTLSFFLMRLAPGSPFDEGRRLTPAIERNVRARYGLDRPLPAQYAHYLGGVLRGDLGPSLKYQDKSVAELIGQALPKSVTIGLAALLLALTLGTALGLAAALRRDSASDHAASLVALIGLCVPTFVTAPLLVLVFASQLGWLPTSGWGGVRNLLLPVVVLALPQVAIIARLVRAGMIEALTANHIRTARAKGLPASRVILRHALPIALLPLVAYLGPACAGLLTGSLVVEQLFGLPGLGRFFVISALQRDYPVVMGVVILYSALILMLNLLADLAQAALDPRIKLA